MPLVTCAGPGSRLYVEEAAEPETFDFYIGPSGSDSNNGLTTGTPWAITALNTKRATYGGLTVGIMDGEYDCSAMQNYLGDGDDNPYPIFQIQGGSEGSPTVIKAVNARAAHLNLRNGATRNKRPCIGQYSGSHGQGWVTIDGLEISGGAMWLMSFFGVAASDLNRSQWKDGIIIQNCELHDTMLTPADNNPAVWFDECINPTMRNNLIYDIWDVGTSYGPCAMMTLSCRGAVFEYNEVYNTRTCVHDKHNNGTNYASDGFIIRNNYIHDLEDYAFIGLDTEYRALAPDDTYQTSYIQNNVIVGTNGGWYCKSNSATRMPIVVSNNTFVLTRNIDSGWIATMATTSDTFSFYNNIHERNGFSIGYLGDVNVSVGALGVIDYNMYDSSFEWTLLSPIDDTSGSGTAYTTLAAVRAATTAEDNSIIATPVFVGGAGAAAYALDTGSPGLNAGKVGGTSGGASCHMGAYDGIITRVGRDWS